MSKLRYWVTTLMSYFISQLLFSTSSIAQTPPPSLSGVWTMDIEPMWWDDNGCYPGEGPATLPAPDNPDFTIEQQGSRIVVSDSFGSWSSTSSSGYGAANEGSIEGDEFRLSSSFERASFEFRGTVSEDGQTISGRVSCRVGSNSRIPDLSLGSLINLITDSSPGSTTVSFTFTRESSTEAVFHYFYINGLNTFDGGSGTGNSQYESGLVQNLVNATDEANPIYRVYNPSGVESSQTLGLLALATQLASIANQSGQADPLLHLSDNATSETVTFINCMRAGNVEGSMMASGDVWEAAFQAVEGFGTLFSENDPVVQEIVGEIGRIVSEENNSPEEKHYFIIIAHSQGNFFAESTAHRLSMMLDPTNPNSTLLSRVGILALASPTSYTNVPGVPLIGFTRQDDAILLLNTLQIGAKHPLPANLPPLGESPLRDLSPFPLVPLAALPGIQETLNVNNTIQCLSNSPTNTSLNVPVILQSHLMPNYLETSSDVFPNILDGLQTLQDILANSEEFAGYRSGERNSNISQPFVEGFFEGSQSGDNLGNGIGNQPVLVIPPGPGPTPDPIFLEPDNHDIFHNPVNSGDGSPPASAPVW